MQADYDYRDFTPNAQQQQDDQLLVKFYIKQRKNDAESLKQGRPIFKDVEYVDIKIAGSRTEGVNRPATFHDKQRFPRHYAAFQQRVEMPVEGTPLAEWPIMSRSMVEELSFHNIKTVEQLVDLNDSKAAGFMGINDLKAKAKKWLDNSEETARINEISELKASSLDKDTKIDQMADLIDSLTARLDDLEKPDTSAKEPKKKK
jgi:hypothetical protein